MPLTLLPAPPWLSTPLLLQYYHEFVSLHNVEPQSNAIFMILLQITGIHKTLIWTSLGQDSLEAAFGILKIE